MKANIFYRYGGGYVHWLSGYKTLEIEQRPVARCNAEPGFYDDPVIIDLTDKLHKQLNAEVIVESVVVLK